MLSKFKFSLYIIVAFIFIQCKNETIIQNEVEYNLNDFKITLNPPKGFHQAEKEYVKEFEDDGERLFKEQTNIDINNEGFFFFFKKGEFSSFKSKKYNLEENIKNDYEKSWRKHNIITYNLMSKMASQESPIDTISRIENINGIKFYVFETNIKMKDINNNDTNLKFLNYNTPIKNTNLSIDASYINNIDEKEILESLKSIKIKLNKKKKAS